MAVEIINFMPDVRVHRGEPVDAPARVTQTSVSFFSRRAAFAAGVIALHVIVAAALISARWQSRNAEEAMPIVASIIEAPAEQVDAPPVYVQPENIAFVLPAPQDINIEVESITPPPATTTAITEDAPRVVTPPLVESVEYIRTPLPVYPRESSRRHEHGTVLLRVLVDTGGRPAQIQIERSSGFERLDVAAREAVERWLFRPHEVNGSAQAVQVLVPIEFTRRAS